MQAAVSLRKVGKYCEIDLFEEQLTCILRIFKRGKQSLRKPQNNVIFCPWRAHEAIELGSPDLVGK